MDRIVEFSVTSWGMTLNTAPLYINLSWGLTIVLVVLLGTYIIAHKIVRARRG